MLNIVATIVRDTSDEYVPPLLYELLDEAQRWIRAAEVAEKTGRDVALVEAPARPSAEFASIVESLVGYAAPSPEQHVGFMAAVRLREQLEREAAV
ncbi:MAG TPA: hypothetical protein PLW10_25215 [Myxococcota bacterium]|nr:hypothetical protein [Myxococcota bacterium]